MYLFSADAISQQSENYSSTAKFDNQTLVCTCDVRVTSVHLCKLNTFGFKQLV